jgi:catechol 2,3-dioxygenase-like lactoylglutathione lyase family enzyme
MLANAEPMTFILTPDIERAKAFYGGTLGLTQTDEDEFAVSYDLNGTLMRLTKVGGWQPHMHTVLGWTVPDIVATIGALKAKGVEMAIYEGFGQDEHGIWTAPDGRAKIAWFHDPDGNNLSIKEG